MSWGQFTNTYLPVSQPKPLVVAIRALLAGGLAVGAAHAELPMPNAVELASHGHATASINGANMTIKQTTDRATLEWQSFNIGAGNKVNFQQPSSTSVALNNIHQADPSRIMGQLTANGQVYLVNQNGFVFGKDSQVNVNALVASSLGISQEVFDRGITKVFDINNAAALEGKGDLFIKNDRGDFVLDQHGQKIKIQILVESGAKIKTPSGGRVVLASPVIDNQGTIETPDGQTILAGATDKVYLQEAGPDSDVRGLLVEVGTGGEVNNVGKVMAERGNASLIGFAVNQKGLVSASTSVNLNGTVRLMAREGIQNPTATGGKLLGKSTLRSSDLGDGLGKAARVNLEAGSLTSVELDADKQATAIDAQQQLQSKIDISGHDVLVKDGATVRAKSGEVNLAAVDNPADPKLKGTARVHLQHGSVIDVSGVKDVSLAMERNVVQVELRKNELRDSPEQRDGVLFGQKVNVDLRDAQISYDPTSGAVTSAKIPVADIKGAVDRIARNIDERSTAGGSINISSSGDVVSQAGSVLDFSGGSVAYRNGFIATTKLVADGEVVDIAEADPNRHYDSILGFTGSWQIPGMQSVHAEAGYVEGKAGGKLNIETYEAALDGKLNGATIAGLHQRESAQQAASSSVTIDLSRGNLLGKQDLSFGAKTNAAPDADQAIARKVTGGKEAVALSLDPALFKQSGVSKVHVVTNGAVTVDADQTLALTNSGSLQVESAGANIQGEIVAASGDISFAPVVAAGVTAVNPITLGANASIDVRGAWVNDMQALAHGGTATSAVAIDGGSVSLRSERGDLTLEQGSAIDVSGGAWLQSRGNLVAGKAGSINLTAATVTGGGKTSSLLLNGQLNGWALHDGGSLSLTSNQVLIGNAGDFTIDPSASVQPLLLGADFFQQGGFANYHLSANESGLTVADGTQIKPVQRNLQLQANASNAASAKSLAAITDKVTLSDSMRHAANLQLSAQGERSQKRDALLTIGNQAAISTDRQATVTLDSDTSVIIAGKIDAPAGTINVNINTPTSGDSGFFASQGIWLGGQSQLSARGVYKAEPNIMGLTLGEVLPGGSINLTANRGYIVGYQGSLLDVSGTQHALDFQQPLASTQTVVSKDIASTGGSIKLLAAEGIINEGSFNAQGGTGAAGGTLSIELNAGLRNKPEVQVAGGAFPDDSNISKPRSIEIAANPVSVLPQNAQTPVAVASQLNGRALLGQQQLNDAGAANLALKVDATAGNKHVGSIVFNGDVTLNAQRSITLDAPTLKTGAGSTVRLNTDYAALGSTKSRIDTLKSAGVYNSVLAPDAVGGSGELDVAANTIDLVGGLSFNGFGAVNLHSRGDVRAVGIRNSRDTKNFLGELKLAGNLTIDAAQLYPTTLSDYTVNLSGSGDQTFWLQGNGNTPAPVLSAGGRLTVNAPNIIQQGILKAPFGSLNLHAGKKLQLADGSLTSVSGDGLNVLFGQVSGGMNWLYPLDSNGSANLLLDTPPEKSLNLTGPEVDLSAGASVDLRGGGDLQAYEFIPGPGGSTDVLDPNSVGFTEKFAVMPSLGHAVTPVDPLEFANSGLKVGDSVYLSQSAGLSAGWYTLLPAHYALLPGAYLVTPQAGSRDMQPGQSYTDYTGATVVAGRYGDASAGIADARWQGFTVENGAVARSHSEYKDYSANSFFAANLAAQLPQDAGRLSIEVANRLSLHAELRAAAANNGRGGQVDISANNLAVVGRREELTAAPASTVALLADDLNKLNAPSLLLGGIRSKDSKGQRLSVSAQTVSISGSTQLASQEILLAAKDQVQVQSGAQLVSTGNSGAAANAIYVSNKTGGSDGALLRVSAGKQAQVIRDQAVTGNSGVLDIQNGVRLAAGGSMLLDSTRNTLFAGKIDMHGGSLALKSSRISLGEAADGTSGLVLKDTAFDLDELLLTSASTLDIYGGVNLDSKLLSIDTAQINGFNNAGLTAKLNVDTLLLSNSKATSSASASGSGSLAINANNVILGSGNYAIDGFKNIAIQATQAIKGQGQSFAAGSGNSQLAAAGVLTVDGDLTMTAGHFTGDNGATSTIAAGNHSVTLNAAADYKSTWQRGLGVSWTVNAGSISGDGRFDMPTGVLALNAASGDIRLDSGALIDLGGVDVSMAGIHRYASAGNLLLSAQSGNVVFNKDAEIRLDGAGGDAASVSNAGLLSVNTPNGHFDWQGKIDAGAKGIGKHGRLRIAQADFGDSSFASLNAQRQTAGFDEAFALSLANGDLNLAATDDVLVHNIELSALHGSVELGSKLDTGAAKGQIAVYGRNGIKLTADAKLNAADGKVLLDTVHRDDDGSGLLDLSESSSIDVTGSAGSGSVHLRSGRDADGNVNVTAINTKITGADARRSNLEATRVYSGVNSIDANAIAGWKKDTVQFMEGVTQAASGLQWLPGLEIRSSGDLTLANKWDLIDWRYQDSKGNNTLPGYLTLNAAGNLLINAPLTDALASGSLPGDSRVYQDMIQAGQSWSYQLSAGGNVELAASYTNSASPQVVVRTGTGSIDVQAGGNIRFNADSKSSTAAAAIYTVGTVADFTRNQLLQGLVKGAPSRLPGESDADYLNRLDPAQMNQLLRFGYLDESRIGDLFQKAEFPTQGGNVSLKAAGNIDGIATGQKISDWLVRSGTLASGNTATLWGINISGDRSNPSVNGTRYFNQNIGALGGGDVSIDAGGTITNLSAMLPTSGKPFGTVSSVANQWLANSTVVNGGGDLRILAGDNIVGGEYFVGLGSADIQSGGNIGSASRGSLFELGDAPFNVQARQDINVAGVLNPTLLSQPQNTIGGESRFFTYGADSAVSFASLAGNVTLKNNAGNSFEYSVYPGSLQAAALSGDISIDKAMTLFPDANGQLTLLANNNLRSAALAGQTLSVNMSDADPSLLPTAANAAVSLEGSLSDGLIRARERLNGASTQYGLIHAAKPLHGNDHQAVKVVANQGDIAFATGSQVNFYLPKAAQFVAGRDIRNLSLNTQNLFAEDVTRVQAGRDIVFDTNINSNGVVLSNNNVLKLGGGGRLQVLAGNSINLGSAEGILTVGNQLNSALADGASIDIQTGLAGKMDFAGFIEKYAKQPDYRKLLANVSTENTDQQVLLPLVLKVLFKEIQASAAAAAAAPANHRGAQYQRGIDAINTLFPDENYHGDLSLVFSQIKTQDGGDINISVPGGKVDVGLAGRQGGNSKAADQLGIVVQRQGNINAFVRDNFNVNQSRVFAQAGGDITIWSAKGSIDAGKGTKSAIAVPPPYLTFDAKGNAVLDFPPSISGSGIKAVGDSLITLAAPEGIVDAGEAGISGANIVLAAKAVVGAGNISFTGGGVGVPSSVAPVVNVGGANAAANAAKSASQMSDNAKNNQEAKDAAARSSTVISVLSTDVVGYGDCSEADVRDGKPGCGG
jgi:filamentous hemagglutinin family protein